MCGIAGYISPRASPEKRKQAVERMCAALQHRGPDDHGLVSRDGATLGARRLAIFDPARGHQPRQSEDLRLTLVFNGALYNFRELRAQLASHGYRFRTECDSEVLLTAFSHWGEGCLPRLRGMFAFAVWNNETRELFLARDPFGIKPLYLHHHPSGDLQFASEINALRTAATGGLEIDPQGVADTLSFLSAPAPQTIYLQVTSLRPGECARWKDGAIERRVYWDIQTNTTSPSLARDQEQFRAELRSRLDDSVKAHLQADVPVGLFLSGGLDSSAIAGIATRLGGRPLKTFSIGFDEASYSESTEAAATARHLHCEHQTMVVTGAKVAGDIDQLLSDMDQPTGDGINTWYASAAARSGGVKVALSGLGGDELFGGYGLFRQLPLLQRLLTLWKGIPRPLRQDVERRLSDGTARGQKMGDFLSDSTDLHDLASKSRRVWSRAAVRKLLSGDVAENPHPALSQLRSTLAGADAFSTLSAWELRGYMADVLLRDSDVMSMRHSLELRVPFIDRPLIEWWWRQPTKWKFTPRSPKSALAESTADVLPPGVAARKKRGFSLPFPVWMRRELRPFLDETFSTASVSRTGLFSVENAQSQWRRFAESSDSRQWSRIWTLAITIAFLNRRTGP